MFVSDHETEFVVSLKSGLEASKLADLDESSSRMHHLYFELRQFGPVKLL